MVRVTPVNTKEGSGGIGYEKDPPPPGDSTDPGTLFSFWLWFSGWVFRVPLWEGGPGPGPTLRLLDPRLGTKFRGSE